MTDTRGNRSGWFCAAAGKARCGHPRMPQFDGLEERALLSGVAQSLISHPGAVSVSVPTLLLHLVPNHGAAVVPGKSRQSGGHFTIHAFATPTVTISTAVPRVYTLMQDVTFTAKVNGGAGTAFKFEEKPAAGGAWAKVSDMQTFKESERLAGYYQIRATATVNGAGVTSLAYTFEVRFPNHDEITGNADVKAEADKLWAATKKYADDNKGAAAADGSYPDSKRREMGYWIQIDTSTGKYQHTAVVNSADAGPGAGASIDLGARPADVIAGVGKSAVYVVASFHTHTPTTFRTVGRGVGPSAADNTADTNDDVTGAVYDYTASPAGGATIPAKYDLNGAAQLYLSGPYRRSTPRT